MIFSRTKIIFQKFKVNLVTAVKSGIKIKLKIAITILIAKSAWRKRKIGNYLIIK